MLNIAVFASGSGTNAENMINYFKNSDKINISLILSNKKDAYVLKRAEKAGVPSSTFSFSDFQDAQKIIPILNRYNIGFIVLAGFLLKVPEYLLLMYPDKIVNIHPALLPKYGGKGMYGERVHQAVIAAGEKESGITVHIIDHNYDCGRTIYQSKCTIEEGDTPETLATKIHELEREYPRVVDEYLKTLSDNL